MEEEKQKKPEMEEEKIIRIMSKDISGRMSLYSGLTKIKGISWAMSASICNALGFNRKTKVGELKSQEIKKIEEFVSNPKLPRFVLNRRKDLSSGKDKHLTSADLDLQKEFDIKKLKKIKSYRGIRHVAGLPLRGQRTRSNFRKNRRKGAGIKKKK
jgi:small subunit ribosomal protein S13